MPGAWIAAFAHVAVEEPGGRDVAGLEEPDQRREPREALRVGIGAPDEREHLELALEVRAVVGEHVHEVVLREVLGAPPGDPGELEAAAVVHVPDRSARACPRGSSANAAHRAASSGSTLRRARTATGASRCARRSRLAVGLPDVLDEAVALQVHPRQPVRALRVAAGDPHEVVLHAERLGVLRDAVRDHDRDRSQHELAEHHVMDDPLAVVEVAPGQHVGELVGPERLERAVVDRRRR